MMKIAVDVMGGDRAPGEILAGVARALDLGFVQADEVLLVGHEERAATALQAHAVLSQVEFRHAEQIVEMCDSPIRVLRGMPESSIQVGLKLIRAGQAGAFLSAGNTGAVVACALGNLGRLPGVKRPGIAVTFQSSSGPVVVLDVGANVHCKPLHLFQYGLMASIYYRDLLGVERPTIGLLNIGEEEEKGNELTRATRDLFADSALNFVGNIEGTDILSGRCNIVVCEGFVGNVVLKVTEGVGVFLLKALTKELAAVSKEAAHEQSASGGSSTGLSGMLQVIQAVGAKLDYAEYGGAPLLGVNGLTFIMHGRSDRRATANALRGAKSFMDRGVIEHIRGALQRDHHGNGGVSA